MKLFKKMASKHNKAFSLIEVLCAICLLALVATPILQAIFSSLKLNMRSREVMGGSDLTSAIMEYVSSKTFDDYSYGTPATTVTGFKTYFDAMSSTGVVAPGISGTWASHTTFVEGCEEQKITNIDYDGYTYDVYIRYNDNGNGAAGTKYYPVAVTVKTVCKPTDGTREIVCCDTVTYIANKY